MSWLVDNANALYVLHLVIAAGLVVAWRFSQRVKYLIFAAIPVVIIALIYVLTLVFVSDAKQLEHNVNAMADAVVAGNVEDLFKHISDDFKYKGMTRQVLYEAARQSIDNNKINNVRISNFNVDELSRSQKSAKTRFRVTATAANGQTSMFVTQADFVLEGKDWKLKTMRFYNPLVNQDQEIGVPGL